VWFSPLPARLCGSRSVLFRRAIYVQSLFPLPFFLSKLDSFISFLFSPLHLFLSNRGTGSTRLTIALTFSSPFQDAWLKECFVIFLPTTSRNFLTTLIPTPAELLVQKPTVFPMLTHAHRGLSLSETYVLFIPLPTPSLLKPCQSPPHCIFPEMQSRSDP